MLSCGCVGGHLKGSVFYTSAQRDDGRYVVLSGPYQTHADALAAVAADKTWAWDRDPRAPWYAYGTCSTTEPETMRPLRLPLDKSEPEA